MNAPDLVRRLHQHRMWVNHRLLTAVQSLSDDELRRSFSIGQGSVWRTLTHLFAAENVWLEALLGNESFRVPGDVPGKLPGNQEGQGAIASLSDLVLQWDELDRRWNKYLEGLSDESLDDVVYRTSSSSGAGKRFGTKRSDILLHVCTHAQYTTAQLNNMLRQLGQSTSLDVMLITLARQESTP
ncbi:DinB family protein [Pirellulaceae bacterium SH467]